MSADRLVPVRVEPGEELEFARSVVQNFFEDPAEETTKAWAKDVVALDEYRAWIVRDGDTPVANYGIYSMDVSVPGGPPLPMAGVTAVGVAQTHRRRGLLRAMMTAGLDDAVERGEPVAMLYASESPIYGRFGFGVTAPSYAHTIDRGAAFHERCAPGLVQPATTEEAKAKWGALYEAVRERRSGAASRSDTLLAFMLDNDPPSWRDGFSPRRLVHVPGRGFAMYRIKDEFDKGLPNGEVRVLALIAADSEAEAALWQHVCDIDLTAKVDAWYRPPDDPLVAMLVDPNRARTHMGPPLYARLLDVAAAFSARTYATADVLTFAVADATRDQSGTYRLEASPEGAEVRRVDDDPELTLPVEVAASVWLGGVRATHMLVGRRLQEHVPGAAARFDRMLATDLLPWNPFEF